MPDPYGAKSGYGRCQGRKINLFAVVYGEDRLVPKIVVVDFQAGVRKRVWRKGAWPRCGRSRTTSEEGS